MSGRELWSTISKGPLFWVYGGFHPRFSLFQNSFHLFGISLLNEDFQ